MSIWIIVLAALAIGIFVIQLAPFTYGFPNGKVTIFNAASTTDVMQEISAQFKDSTGSHARLNPNSSSTLARQIAEGAAVDVFLSANPEWMDYLEDQEMLHKGTRRDLLSNRLVLIAPADSDLEVTMERGFDLAGAFKGRLALGNPDHVPAGEYAAAALKSMGWLDQLSDRLAPFATVRRALWFVETGDAPLGVVYATDAAMSDKVKVLATFPQDSHPPIRYPVAMLACASDCACAKAFYEFLFTPEAARIFEKYGFTVLAQPEKPENAGQE